MEAKINEILIFIQSLSYNEIMFLIAITAVLVLFIAYRWFGVMAVGGLVIIYLMSYILYTYDIISAFDKQENANIEHSKIIQEELNK